MKTVADSTPLIALSEASLLGLLEKLYGEVLIAPAVEHEAFKIRRRALPPWVRVDTPPPDASTALLDENLDRPESETLILAAEREADLVLIDDRRGRVVARSLGFRVAGTAAILLGAKERGLVTHVAQVLDRLTEAGLRISPELYAAVVRRAGEGGEPR